MAGGDFVHMDTAGVTSMMRGLADHGLELDRGWQSAKDAISQGEAGTGGDVLGQAFRTAYEEAGRAMRAAADRLPGALAAHSDACMRCAEDYLSADARARGAFPGEGA
jgi:hypothetical protein